MEILLCLNILKKLIFVLQIVDSIISHGSFLTNCLIEHSLVGIRSRVNSNAHLKVSFVACALFLNFQHFSEYPEHQPELVCITLSEFPKVQLSLVLGSGSILKVK